MKNQDDEAAGTDAFKIFVESFGNMDEYTRVIIEVLLEEIMGANGDQNS